MKTFLIKIIPQLVVLLCISIGCSDQFGNKPIETIRVDYSDAVEPIDVGNILRDKIHIVPLESSDDIIIGDVKSIRISDAYIYVFDGPANTIYRFNHNGGFIDKLRKVGRARDEYYKITDFAVTNNELVILDHISSRVLMYDLNNFEFKNSCSFRDDSGTHAWGNEFAYVNDEIILINNHSETTQGYYHIYRLVDNKFEPMAPYAKNGRELGWSLERYGCSNNSELLFNIPPFDTIYHYNKGIVQAKYFVDLGSEKISRKAIYKEKRNALQYAIKNNLITSIDGVNQIYDYILFRFQNRQNSYSALYSVQEKSCLTGQGFWIKSLGGYPVTEFYRDGDYFISSLSASSYRFFLSDNLIKSKNVNFNSESDKQRVINIRDNITDTSNPVVLFSKLND